MSTAPATVYSTEIPTEHKGTWHCPLMRTMFSQAQCVAVTSVPHKNINGCAKAKCTSPWRICSSCLLNNETDAASHVVNAATGLCSFHQIHGKNACKRDHQTAETTILPQHPNPPPVPPQQEPEATASNDALIEQLLQKAIANAKGPFTVPTERVRVFPDQPRKHFDQAKLAELAAGIRATGQIHSVLFRPVADDPAIDYELVDGERRWRACQIAGVPVRGLEIEVDDATMQFVISVASNFGRENHTSLEIARMLDHLVNGLKWNMERAARICGRSAVWGYNNIKLVQLDPRVQRRLEPDTPPEERISPMVGIALVKFEPDVQHELATIIANKKLGQGRGLQFIQQQVHKRGIDYPSKGKRGTAKDFQNMLTYLQGTNGRFVSLLEMPPEQFRLIFGNRSMAVQREFVTTLQDLEENVRAFREAAERSMNAEVA